MGKPNANDLKENNKLFICVENALSIVMPKITDQFQYWAAQVGNASSVY